MKFRDHDELRSAVGRTRKEKKNIRPIHHNNIIVIYCKS